MTNLWSPSYQPGRTFLRDFPSPAGQNISSPSTEERSLDRVATLGNVNRINTRQIGWLRLCNRSGTGVCSRSQSHVVLVTVSHKREPNKYFLHSSINLVHKEEKVANEDKNMEENISTLRSSSVLSTQNKFLNLYIFLKM